MVKNTCSCLLALVLSVAYDGEISEGQLQGKNPVDLRFQGFIQR